MYIPEHYQIKDLTQCLHHISENPFGHLSLLTKQGQEIHSLPFLVKGITKDEKSDFVLPFIGTHGSLIGHIARANDIWRRVENSTECLVHFPLSDSYITPSWYPEKQVAGKVVPTWNYVHIYAWGKIEFITDQELLLKFVSELSNHMEKDMDKPWAVSDAPETYVRRLIRGIIGIKISVEKIAGKQKLDQKDSLENQKGMKKELEQIGHPLSQFIE